MTMFLISKCVDAHTNTHYVSCNCDATPFRRLLWVTTLIHSKQMHTGNRLPNIATEAVLYETNVKLTL